MVTSQKKTTITLTLKLCCLQYNLLVCKNIILQLSHKAMLVYMEMLISAHFILVSKTGVVKIDYFFWLANPKLNLNQCTKPTLERNNWLWGSWERIFAYFLVMYTCFCIYYTFLFSLQLCMTLWCYDVYLLFVLAWFFTIGVDNMYVICMLQMKTT